MGVSTGRAISVAQTSVPSRNSKNHQGKEIAHVSWFRFPIEIREIPEVNESLSLGKATN
jgi:hypothetical protein